MQRIRLGMVGGGHGAFIGAVHRMAARLDGHFDLVAMAPSSDPERSIASGAELGLDPQRVYTDFYTMAQAEKLRTDGIQVVSIVTPNHLHYPVACAFLDADIHVICDKPLTLTLDQAVDLQARVRRTGLVFAVTYTYSGYPMVRQARAMVQAGALGDIRVVQVEYAQDWLASNIEASGHKQALWRTDPAQAGFGGCIGDIGTHAYHLACFVTGLQVEQLAADLTSFVPGRQVDDDAQVRLRFANGARGNLWASQIASGCQNALTLRVFGSKASLSFRQEAPNELWYTPVGGNAQRLSRGGADLFAAATEATRIPAGHPEGYLEAFAQLYSETAQRIRAHPHQTDGNGTVPGIAEGVQGMQFIHASLASHAANGAWVVLDSV